MGFFDRVRKVFGGSSQNNANTNNASAAPPASPTSPTSPKAGQTASTPSSPTQAGAPTQVGAAKSKGVFYAMFDNSPPVKPDKNKNKIPDPQNPGQLIHVHDPTNTTVNRYITAASFFIWIFVICIQIWLIVNTLQASRSRDSRVAAFEAHRRALVGNTTTSAQATASSSAISSSNAKHADSHAASRANASAAATRTGDEVFWASKRSATAVAGNLTLFYVDPSSQAHHRRSLSKSQGVFEETPAKCLYIPGSQLPDKGALALAIVIIYQVWTILIVLAIIYYDQRKLRYNRSTFGAFVVGLVEGWLGVDVLVRGVELQIQVAASLIFLVAFANLLLGWGPTYTQRERILWMIFAKRDWGKAADGAMGEVRDTIAIIQDNAKEAEKIAKASGKDPSAVPVKTLGGRELPEADLKPAAPIQAYLTDHRLLQGKSTADANAEYGAIPEAARNAIPGGVFDPSKRVIGQQEMISRLLFDSMGGGTQSGAQGNANATGGAAGSNANNGGGSMMEKLLMMQMLGGFSGNQSGGLFGGGNANPPVQPNPYAQPPALNPYAQPVMVPPAMYSTGQQPQDDALARFYQREAAKQQAQRYQQGWQ